MKTLMVFAPAAAPGGRERTGGRPPHLGAWYLCTGRARLPLEPGQKRSVPAANLTFCDGSTRHAQWPRDACQCEQCASGMRQPGALGRAPMSRAMALLFEYCRLGPNCHSLFVKYFQKRIATIIRQKNGSAAHEVPPNPSHGLIANLEELHSKAREKIA